MIKVVSPAAFAVVFPGESCAAEGATPWWL